MGCLEELRFFLSSGVCWLEVLRVVLLSVRLAAVHGPCAYRPFVAVACALHTPTNRPVRVLLSDRCILYLWVRCCSGACSVSPGIWSHRRAAAVAFPRLCQFPRISGATSPERGCGACIQRPLASVLRPLAAGPVLRRRLDRFTPCPRAGLLLPRRAVYVL